MIKFIRIFLLVLIILGIGLLMTQQVWVPKVVELILKSEQSKLNATVVSTTTPTTPSTTKVVPATPATSLTDAQVLAMADNKFADGSVPLGDYKYVTDAPKQGYVYLCNVHKDNPGSMVTGTWVHGDTWNWLQKVNVSGNITWSNAKFSNIISGVSRLLTGNDLPVGYATGVFPVAANDPAYKFDPNPNTIKTQTLTQKFPANPVYSDTPYCMGGEVGVMTDGVALFNAFDAGLRDAPAHELQDSCDGHPQGSGEYHYHSIPSCFKDLGVKTVIGYALDGFPITGPKVATDKYLTTEDLDVCHGITSTITIDKKAVTTYHYVMTKDFPYSASCFRGKPVSLMIIGSSGASGPQGSSPTLSPQGPISSGSPSNPPTPPQQALDACAGKAQNSTCSFATPNMGTIYGTCQTPPNSSLACVPSQQ